ncbi:pathogenesis-related thaumatin-like protein 3.5 [Malania oleifera]|uniref:pathogenesis-related thaumatin-like protein 3.5 n=1 Tax=Malania oleifera TaxID=397392 RepID=UPI0025ADD0E2|nr:pathogenesis-related thaumatin-like protein 3.5 [Malania oleifera]
MGLCNPALHLLITALSFLATATDHGAAVFTLHNNCRNTVWPGILPGAGKPTLMNGGLRLRPAQSVNITAPAGWSGRFWGRRFCSFDPSGRNGTCATGDCGGSLHCAGAGGVPPATLAEFTLGSPLDFYDVSLVDGYNMRMSVVPYGGSGGSCTRVSCISDLNRHCPTALQVRRQGRVVGCKSACAAYGSPEYCCTGEYGSPKKCKPTKYSKVFKAFCPSAYSYAYDDQTSTFTCESAHYLITFC